jgi:tetratricopeptide (TPR) repeat protein
MRQDQYDNPLSTTSDAARDHYVAGLDLLLAGQPGITDAFRSAVNAEPAFVLGLVALARGHQFEGDMAAASAAMAAAKALPGPATRREASHLNAFGLLVDGKTQQAYAAIRAHVTEFPRDALVAQTCSSVFGLIGFSGKPGREAEILAYTAALLPHYGEDWWCLSQYAFALCETGNLDAASDYIDRSLALNPLNANAAHVRSHVHYEAGETALGISFLADWLKSHDRNGYLFGHLSWHAALWSLEQGDTETMWQRIQTDILPDVSNGLPINVLTDTASILYRAELAGEHVPQEYWTRISAYARQFFPKSALGFTDIHAALAHAMAGDGDALMIFIDSPNPVTGNLIIPVAEAYRALAAQHWEDGVTLLVSAMGDHARLGGSRAQRDLLEFSLLGALLRMGKGEEAKRLLALRRPNLVGMQAVHGLTAH